MHTLDQSVFSVLTVTLLWMVIAVFCVSIAALLISMGLHKHHRYERARRFQNQVDHYARAIVRFMAGDAVHPIQVEDFEQVTALSTALAKTLEPNRVLDPALGEMIRRTQAPAHLLPELNTQDWGQRYRAVSAAGDLGLPEFFEPVVELAHGEENTKIFGICLYAAAQLISDPSQVKALYDLTASRADLAIGYSEGMFRIAIQSLMQRGVSLERLDAILEHCLKDSRADEQHQLSLILAIGKEKLVSLKEMLVRIAHQPDKQRLLTTILRCLHSMGECDPLIGAHIGSVDLMVNIAAIRAAENCAPDIVPKIVAQLGAADFNIRYAAAQTLTRLGEPGHRALQEREYDQRPEVQRMASFALAVESR